MASSLRQEGLWDRWFLCKPVRVSLSLSVSHSLWGPLTQNICRSVLPSFTSTYFGSLCHYSSASNTSTSCINIGWFICSVASKGLYFHLYKSQVILIFKARYRPMRSFILSLQNLKIWISRYEGHCVNKMKKANQWNFFIYFFFCWRFF